MGRALRSGMGQGTLNIPHTAGSIPAQGLRRSTPPIALSSQRDCRANSRAKLAKVHNHETQC